MGPCVRRDDKNRKYRFDDIEIPGSQLKRARG
jgi:hypothetical protein